MDQIDKYILQIDEGGPYVVTLPDFRGLKVELRILMGGECADAYFRVTRPGGVIKEDTSLVYLLETFTTQPST